MESNTPGLGPAEEQGASSVENTSSVNAQNAFNGANQTDVSGTDPVMTENLEATPPQPVASDEPLRDENDESAEHPVESEPVAEVEATPEPQAAANSANAAPNAAPDAVSDAVSPAPAEPAEPTGPRLKRGTLVEGTVIATSPTQVTVDVGMEAQGIIPGHELEKMGKSTLDSLREGAPITVYVVNPHDHNGNIVLSVNRALEELDWQRAEEFRQSQEVFETRVAGYNKGGLIVRFGRVRGFVPQSQMGMDRRRTTAGETPEERWGKMVNEPIAVKVMEVDRSRNRLILSERSASRESREKRKEVLIEQLHEGEVRAGRVVSLEDFGAFVDVGGAEGLVHLTELSWKHVTHPRELLRVGQEVRVEVISVDRDAKRIGLSMKRQEPDPWDMIAINYNVGQLVRGRVTKLTKFGAFARLVDVPEIEGLIHISELSDRRVNHPREVVQENDELTLRVVKMDIANRRLGLSLKRVNSAEYLDQDWLNAPISVSSEPEPTASTPEVPAEVPAEVSNEVSAEVSNEVSAPDTVSADTTEATEPVDEAPTATEPDAELDAATDVDTDVNADVDAEVDTTVNTPENAPENATEDEAAPE